MCWPKHPRMTKIRQKVWYYRKIGTKTWKFSHLKIFLAIIKIVRKKNTRKSTKQCKKFTNTPISPKLKTAKKKLHKQCFFVPRRLPRKGNRAAQRIYKMARDMEAEKRDKYLDLVEKETNPGLGDALIHAVSPRCPRSPDQNRPPPDTIGQCPITGVDL